MVSNPCVYRSLLICIFGWNQLCIVTYNGHDICRKSIVVGGGWGDFPGSEQFDNDAIEVNLLA